VSTARRGLIAGAAGTLVLRSVLEKLILFRLRRDVAKLNAGDYGPFLSAFADDAVLHFNEGAHRWSGDHRGKAAIERFLRDFTGAGLRGEIGELWFRGPLWAMQVAARFNDEARGADGELIYSNEVVVVVKTRWGKVIEQDDFYRDTSQMEALERHLQSRGVEPVDAPSRA
jgi:ketosteroid isomerase-like protein